MSSPKPKKRSVEEEKDDKKNKNKDEKKGKEKVQEKEKEKKDKGNKSPKRKEKDDDHDSDKDRPAKKKKPNYTLNVNQVVDKVHEVKLLKDIVDLPPSGLQGLAARADESLSHLHIKTIAELGNWKYFHIARAISVLAKEGEEKGKRSSKADANINKAVKKEYETQSLTELLDAPISALQGIGEQNEKHLNELGIKTVAKLADYKYAHWAEALVELAKHEAADHSS